MLWFFLHVQVLRTLPEGGRRLAAPALLRRCGHGGRTCGWWLRVLSWGRRLRGVPRPGTLFLSAQLPSARLLRGPQCNVVSWL